MKYGLSEDALAVLFAYFKKHNGIQKVILYGSRALGTYRAGSDIDITLVTDANFTFTDLFGLKMDLEDSELPYLFDVSIFDKLKNSNLSTHINNAGKIIYERTMEELHNA